MQHVLRLFLLILALAPLAACGDGMKTASPQQFARERDAAKAQRDAVHDDECKNGGVKYSYEVRGSQLQQLLTTGLNVSDIAVCVPRGTQPPSAEAVIGALLESHRRSLRSIVPSNPYSASGCPTYYGWVSGPCEFYDASRWWRENPLYHRPWSR